MPTEQYYHPFGLASHAVTYSGYQVLKKALQWAGPTAVSVVQFGTRRTKRGITVSWRTANESHLAGFNL
jgi:hypothetical protein